MGLGVEGVGWIGFSFHITEDFRIQTSSLGLGAVMVTYPTGRYLKSAYTPGIVGVLWGASLPAVELRRSEDPCFRLSRNH